MNETSTQFDVKDNDESIRSFYIDPLVKEVDRKVFNRSFCKINSVFSFHI